MEGLLPIRTNGPYTFDYLFGVGGEELGLYSAGTSAWFDQNVPMGRRVLVKYGSPLRILHANKLGTTTVVTDQTGAELEDHLFYPWGQSWTLTGRGYDNHFAGMKGFESPEQLYPTDFRKYNPALGRWMSPDPLGGDVTNPQSFNRYAYVLNNPVSNTDPLGLASDCTQGSDGRLHCGQGDSVTVNGGSGGGTLLPGGCADVYVDGLYEGNTCSAPYFGGGGSYPTFVYPPGTSPGGGGNASASGPPGGPVPSYGQVLKSFNQCAASFADRHSVASSVSRFLHFPNNPVLDAALGSTTAAASRLIFKSDPKEYVPAGASLAGGAKAGTALNLGASAAGKIELNPGFQSIFTRVAPTTLSETALGRTALSGVRGAAGLLKDAAPALILYDEIMYGVGEGVCTAQAF